jgi:hypothetical protein
MEKLETKLVRKSQSEDKEYQFTSPPHAISLRPHLPESDYIVLNVGALRQMLEGLSDDDSFRIQWFAGNKATEYSYLKRGDRE